MRGKKGSKCSFFYVLSFFKKGHNIQGHYLRKYGTYLPSMNIEIGSKCQIFEPEFRINSFEKNKQAIETKKKKDTCSNFVQLVEQQE